DLHTVVDGAPVAGDRGHCAPLLHLLIAGGAGPYGGRLEVGAILAWDLCGDGEANELLGLAVERGVRVELDGLELVPGAGDARLREDLEETRHHAERLLDVLIGGRSVAGRGWRGIDG